jgi:hypothetical protein
MHIDDDYAPDHHIAAVSLGLQHQSGAKWQTNELK